MRGSLVFIITLFFISFSLFSSETEKKSPLTEPSEKIHMASDSLKFDFSADFRSRHIWRGNLTCSAWSVQPTMNLTSSNFLVGIWGAYTVDNSYTEFDLYASYTYKRFTIAILDYFCPSETVKFNHLFNYSNKTTKHTLDAVLSFNGTQRFPLSISASTLFFGDDKNPSNGENYFSTYIEASYKWEVSEQLKSEFHVGLTPFEGYYSTGANVVSCGLSITQNLQISSSFKLPINGKLIINPNTENVFFVLGFTLGYF
ncbi:MAG TPA: hypothetical protein P5200_05285 [Tenuifilaceae bacterium]|nr:hypothetical protein [Tenuifilaceae bacterium]HPQ34280.1 hypothetical protein [Tenuifilaceae bacterium]HRX67764.1 hypothetical protein [Tenuifilaceae bacterium]